MLERGAAKFRSGRAANSAALQQAFPKPFINIKFHGSLFARGDRGNPTAGQSVVVSAKMGVSDMKKAILAITTAATIGGAALVAPSPAHAWRGGWGPGLAGGLIAGAVIGGIASSAYAYGPGYGYYGGPRYGYYGGGYAPVYYNYGYAPVYYDGGYYGPPYQPPYAYYGGPRYYGGYGW